VICLTCLSASLAKRTLEKIIPHFLTLYRDPQEAPLRPHILTGLNTVVEAVLTRIASSTPDSESPLAPYKDDVLATFLSGLNQPATSQASVDGLRNLVQVKKLLSAEELGFVVHNVSEHLLSAEGDVLGLLNVITEISPTPVEDIALPVLIQQLPDRPPSREDTTAQARITSALAALRTICVHPVLFERLVVRLTTKIDIVATAEGTGDMASAYIHVMLSTFSGLVSEKLEKGHVDVGKYVEGLVLALYHLFLRKIGEQTMEEEKLDAKVVGDAAEIISLVVSALPAE
jgi:DNA repair/transcription protein MET18/MMS19